ncbi:MAG: hypothetical protein EZS28_004957 [Streblomastix strix]|uniref:Uncharacterized protein n=1 Tax=Streblomastix strix TaxID=222440 RepID=A0A5J4WXI6_9EUKA|nr:MAG: hypothetical protein EZS28_004957 [Streblomastix strix]
MSKKLFETIRSSDTLDQPNENAKLEEVPLLVNGLLSENSENSEIQSQITERLITIALHDQDSGSFISYLYLSPLIVMLKSKDEKHSNVACEALSKLIRKSPNIQKALVENGFVQMTTFALIEEGVSHHVQSNILVVILDLITSGADIRVMGGLLPILEKLVQEKDSKQQEITMKAKMIQTLLAGQGITGSSSNSEIQELNRNNEELKKKIKEFERKDEEQKKQIIDLEHKINLEHQIKEAKPKIGDVAISINVPTGSYTKKDGEFTYTSTQGQFKVFQINPVITEGIYKCEFKGTFNTSNDWIGVMKSGLNVPFGSHTNTQLYAKDSMFFQTSYVFQNGKPTMAGNKTITNNDIVSIEVNMNTTPRTAHLFINNVQQPGYISGLPESIQYYFQLWTMGQPATVLSLKRLSAPTVTNISNAKEVKWE